jgi:hypothetical protein
MAHAPFYSHTVVTGQPQSQEQGNAAPTPRQAREKSGCRGPGKNGATLSLDVGVSPSDPATNNWGAKQESF